MRRDVEAVEPSLLPARSLAALVDDMPEVTDGDDAGERTGAVAIAGTQTQTIPRVERGRRRRWKRVVVAILVVAALAASAWGAWTYVIPHEAVVPPTAGLTVGAMSAQLTDLGFVVKTGPGQYSIDVPAGRVLKLRPSPGTTLDEGATVMIVPSLGPPPVDLPAVVGKPLARAKDLLRSAGLVPVVTKSVFDYDVAAGSVLSQDPSTPQAPKGSQIQLVVSKGPPPANLPNVIGKMQDEATRRLEAQDFGVSVIEEFSNDIEEGRVISQSPSGAEAPYGSTITLTVSKGPEQFPAPDFRGLSKSAAQALADRYGLTPNFQTVPGTTGSVVFSQSPGVGVTVRYGDTITLFMV
jgi:serine/threonine-protein kinase